MKAFRIDLKACLGLVLPNQYCIIVITESEAGLWVMFFHVPRPNLCGPYYTVLLYCMITTQSTVYVQSGTGFIQGNVNVPGGVCFPG